MVHVHPTLLLPYCTCARYVQNRVVDALNLLSTNVNHAKTRNSLHVICTALAPHPAEFGDGKGMGKQVWGWADMRRSGVVAQAATSRRDQIDKDAAMRDQWPIKVEDQLVSRWGPCKLLSLGDESGAGQSVTLLLGASEFTTTTHIARLRYPPYQFGLALRAKREDGVVPASVQGDISKVMVKYCHNLALRFSRGSSRPTSFTPWTEASTRCGPTATGVSTALPSFLRGRTRTKAAHSSPTC